MKQWFSAAEFAERQLPGLPGTKNGIIRLARRQGWESRARRRDGGGREYHLSMPPEAARIELARRHRISAGKTGAAINGDDTGAAREADLAALPHLDGKSRDRAHSRGALLEMLKDFEADAHLGAVKARKVFAALYNGGDIDVDSDLREEIPTVSAVTLGRWQATYRKHGPAALGGNYGNRRGLGAIERNPAIEGLIVGMLTQYPHCGSGQIMRAMRAKQAALGWDELPAYRTVQRFLTRWRANNAQVLMAVTNPDKHRSKYQAAAGSASEDVHRLNQRWEIDSTPADILLSDGSRHAIIGLIDVFSRRMKLLVCRTSKSTAITALIRRAMIDWGVPETVKTDNGADYVSKQMRRVLDGLEIRQILCKPFTPESKPHIERGLGTFSHDVLELLPGYIGHSVADRKDIEARKAFSARLGNHDRTAGASLTSEELQKFADGWTENIYHHDAHRGLGGKTPFQVAAAWPHTVRKIKNEHALDVLLSETASDGGWRTVTKKGIRVEAATFNHAALGGLEGERVLVLLDETDLGEVYIFDDAGEFICHAICPERAGVSRKAVAIARRKHQRDKLAVAKRELRQTAKDADIDDIARQILEHGAEQAGKLARLPGKQEDHETPGLHQAGRVGERLYVDDVYLTDEARKHHDAFVRQEARRSEETVVKLPETSKERFRRALWVEKQMELDLSPSSVDLFWLGGYQRSAEFRAQTQMYKDFGQDWLNG